MAYDVDPACDTPRCKTITLGGRDFLVAPLPLRHVLAIADLIPKLAGISIENMRGAMFEPIVDLVHRGLLRTYPSLTRDDLLDLPITLTELFEATPIVIGQAGGRRADAAAGEI
jgi:hypothetical protein